MNGEMRLGFTVVVNFSPPPLNFTAPFLDRFPFPEPPPESFSWTGEIEGGGTKVDDAGKGQYSQQPNPRPQKKHMITSGKSQMTYS